MWASTRLQVLVLILFKSPPGFPYKNPNFIYFYPQPIIAPGVDMMFMKFSIKILGGVRFYNIRFNQAPARKNSLT